MNAVTNAITINPNRDIKPLIIHHDAIHREATELQVTDQESYDKAGKLLVVCSEGAKAIEAEFAPDKAAINRLHKLVLGRIKSGTELWAGTRKILESKMRPWFLEKRAQEQAEQALANARAEAQRQEMLEEAERLKRQGMIRDARAIEQDATEIVAPIVSDPAPKVEGLSNRLPWIGECTDPLVLIKAIADGRFPLLHTIPVRGGGEERVPILEINPKVLTYYAKEFEDKMSIPGCTSRQDVTFVARG